LTTTAKYTQRAARSPMKTVKISATTGAGYTKNIPTNQKIITTAAPISEYTMNGERNLGLF